MGAACLGHRGVSLPKVRALGARPTSPCTPLILRLWVGAYSTVLLRCSRGKAVGVFVCACTVTQLCQTPCHPMACRLPFSSVHGILQARILEWVAIPFSRGSSQPRDQTYISFVSCIAGRFFTTEPPGKSRGKNPVQ